MKESESSHVGDWPEAIESILLENHGGHSGAMAY